MKNKKIWLGLVCGLCLLSASVSHAQTAPTAPIFKVQGYSYDRLLGVYTLKQYGSAVLVAPNILLTNAHVVTDDNGKFTLQYEACQTVDTQSAPTCFSSLQLLSYDKNSDLALLQIVNPSDDMSTPVTLGTGTLSGGVSIQVVGYPANGGETISTTQGTIAGFEDGYYKTDANIDAGNSGGGGFDSAGALIGVPTFVVNGQTTMGYLIPISTIKSFMAGEIGTTYKVKYSLAFDTWLKKVYALQSAENIENNLFITPSFSGLKLTPTAMLEKSSNHLYNYTLSDADGDAIYINSLIATDNAAIQKYINHYRQKLRDSDLTTTQTTKRIGTTSWTIVAFSGETEVGYDYIQTSSTNKKYMEYTIIVDPANDDKLDGFVDFVERIVIKKPTIKSQVLNIPGIKLSSKWNLGIVKWIDDQGLNIYAFPSGDKFAIHISAVAPNSPITLKKMTSTLEDMYDNTGLTVNTETSKYASVSILRITDDNDKQALVAITTKQYGGKAIFVECFVDLKVISAKSDALNLVYKILGLQ